MTRMTPLRSTCSGVLLLLGLSILMPTPVMAEELVFKKASSDFCAEIDGAYAPDVKFFVSDPPGSLLLVDLPSLSTSVLLEVDEKKVVTLTSADIRREANPSSMENEGVADNGESNMRLVVQLPQYAPSYSASQDKSALSFEIGVSEVRILRGSNCRKAVSPAIPVAGQELVLRASNDYCAEIDGAHAPDARFFTTEPKGRLLIDLPSLSRSALVTLNAQKLVTLPRSTFKLEAGESKARLVGQIAPETLVSSLVMGESAWSFKINHAEVRILEASKCLPVVPRPPPGEPVTDDPEAKKCLHQDSRPIPETAGCTKGVFLRNSCDVPVVAVVQITMHLFSGTLPQTTSVVIPPGVDHPLGCAWSRGAMGPENYEVLTAAFAAKTPGPRPGQRGSAKH
jgi:hypothetical protein